MSYQSVFLHQTARKSTEIARSHGNHRLAMVLMQKYLNPTHKPPPLFCLMLACRKGGGGYLQNFTAVVHSLT